MEGRWGMFKFLGRLAAQPPLVHLRAAWVLLGALVASASGSGRRLGACRTTTFASCPNAAPAQCGYRMLEEAFPQDVFASKVIFAVERP